MPNPSQECTAYFKAPNKDLKDIYVLCTFKIKIESQIQNIGLLKTSNYIQIKIQVPNPGQESPASSKAPNQDSKDMDVL